LLDARPQRNDANIKAALDLASEETTGLSSEHRRLKVVTAIRRLASALDTGRGAAEGEHLLLRAIAAAQHWVTPS
jgi:hypothetical protein